MTSLKVYESIKHLEGQIATIKYSSGKATTEILHFNNGKPHPTHLMTKKGFIPLSPSAGYLEAIIDIEGNVVYKNYNIKVKR